ncbi:MAG: uncharacterized protein JWM64_2935 [Frankiales bacterium]|nr:uncharacterized protein [Frankiales bacterium]
MITLDQARSLKGKTLYGTGGEKLGTIDTLYADRDGGEPTFATVHTGMFGAKTHFVPLASAEMSNDGVMVPYAKTLVNDAPNIDPDTDLSPAEEQRLYSHYGVTGGGYTETATTGTAGFENTHGTVGHDTSGPTTDDAMTRSEERLQVGTEKVEAGRARLRKYITSETETRTVPVSHEEVTIEREPITDGNVGKALDGPNLSEEEHEVVLTEERPVVAKETVPVERVRLGTETVTEQAQVTEEVRKEQIDTDGVYPAGETTGAATTGTRTETDSELTVEPRK